MSARIVRFLARWALFILLMVVIGIFTRPPLAAVAAWWLAYVHVTYRDGVSYMDGWTARGDAEQLRSTVEEDTDGPR